VAPNLVRSLEAESTQEVVFSDSFAVRLADGTRLRGCFALWKRTRHILALAFDYGMPASLVVTTVNMLTFAVPGAIWHSDQGQPYGAEMTRQALLEKGFQLSMSRAGTPTDNGYAERFVGLFKLAVAERQPYRTLGDFLRAAEQWVNFYNTTRPHESLGYRSPDQYAREQGLEGVPSITLL
jgi:transposase InsO family protein